MAFFYTVCPAKSDLKKEFEILEDYVILHSEFKDKIMSDPNSICPFQGFRDPAESQLSRNLILTRLKYSEFKFLSFYYEMFISSLHLNWAELTDFSLYMFFKNLRQNKNQLLPFLQLIDTVIPDNEFVLSILQFMKNKLGVKRPEKYLTTNRVENR